MLFVVSYSQNLNFAVPQKYNQKLIKKFRHFFLYTVHNIVLYGQSLLNTLLTDRVESRGSSSVLVKVLNHLGVCLVQTHFPVLYSTSKPHTIQVLANFDAFIVVSADNLDFMHSFACVFVAIKISSWHGTTVQVVQPLPSLSILMPCDTHSLCHMLTTCTKTHTMSPSALETKLSPSPTSVVLALETTLSPSPETKMSLCLLIHVTVLTIMLSFHMSTCNTHNCQGQWCIPGGLNMSTFSGILHASCREVSSPSIDTLTRCLF